MLTAERFIRSGKVRDLFALPDGRLVLVASDRISAFDVILPTEIPEKGKVLTGLSRFWFGETRSIVRNHLLDTDPDVIGDAFLAHLEASAEVPTLPQPEWPDTFVFDEWRGRLMVCQPASVIPIEAVVRGYLSGSGWKEYRETGRVCGVALPPGLRESDRLPEPIFTPATKAPLGEHDRNISFDEAIDHVATTGPLGMSRPRAPRPAERAWVGGLMEAVRAAAIKLYRYGAAVSDHAGILLADTKFEFGMPMGFEFALAPAGPPEEQIQRRQPIGHTPDAWNTDEPVANRLLLIDEVMTPDSSRLWDAATYAPGGPQASFDKQFVRDWLETQAWDKTDPGPALPPEVVAGTRSRYVEAYERITGASFERYLREDIIAPEAKRT